MEIRVRALLGGILSYIPGLYGLWDKLRPMGHERNAAYGFNVWNERLSDVKNTGIKFSYDSVVELGPGRNLSASISALLDGAKNATAVDVVRYANMEDNLSIVNELIELKDDSNKLSEEKIIFFKKSLENYDENNVLNYKVPWTDSSIIPENSIDFVFSLSVMGHVNNPCEVYLACYKRLRPGGIVCHKIDHSSHGITKNWNGHYWLSSFMWKLVTGKRPYLINRYTPHEHKISAISAGLKIVSIECSDDEQKLSNKYYGAFKKDRYKDSDINDLFVRASILIAQKPF